MLRRLNAIHSHSGLLAATTKGDSSVSFRTTAINAVSGKTHTDEFHIWMHGIVGDEFDGLDSHTIGEHIAGLNPTTRVVLHVNSPGGLAYDGISIFNAILGHPGDSVGVIEGTAGSAASLAVMACDTVRCHVGGVFHPHYSLILAIGHKHDLRNALEIVEMLDADLERLYAARSGRSLEQVREDLQGKGGDGTPFNAEQAREAGYVDEIVEVPSRMPGKNEQNEDEEPDASRRHRVEILRKRLDLISRSK